MRCNRHYMNPNKAEQALLRQFMLQCGGRAWLSRQLLESQLVHTGCMTQRTFDRTARKLEKWGLITSIPTKDRGAVYALLETAKQMPFLKESVTNTDTRGAVTISMSPPVKRVSEEDMDELVARVESSGRSLSIQEQESIRQWKEYRRLKQGDKVP